MRSIPYFLGYPKEQKVGKVFVEQQFPISRYALFLGGMRNRLS